MKAYEVFLKLVRHGRRIGLVCVTVTASSPFNAALAAEREVDQEYGQDVYGHLERVKPMDKGEPLAA